MCFLKCNKCGHLNEVKSEYLVFCQKCNRKLENNFQDWKVKNPDKTFDDFKELICVSEKKKADRSENLFDSIINTTALGYTDVSPKREIWKEIAEEFNGIFKINYNSGQEVEIHNVSIPYKKWNIQISVSDAKPLKFQVNFDSNQNFELVLGWEDFIDNFLKKLGFHEIEIGSPDFDKRYLIKSSDPEKAKKLMSLNIQMIFLKYDIYSLSYQTNQNYKTSELLCVIQRMPGNKDMIIEIINMFKLLIDNLLREKIIMA